MFRVSNPSPPSGQSDAEPARAFVSYAREDAVFKDRIVEALRLRGLDVRGDWQLIRGEDYETQLDALQLTSDVLIFVLSPDSFRSQACRAELDRAAVQNKPIFPLVHRDLAADQENNLPAPLKAPQWAFLRAGDDFVAGVQRTTSFDMAPARHDPGGLLESRHESLGERSAAVSRAGPARSGLSALMLLC
jgi:hypothetical protein